MVGRLRGGQAKHVRVHLLSPPPRVVYTSRTDGTDRAHVTSDDR